MLLSNEWKWPTYYWNVLKHVGALSYRTWRAELFSSIPIGFFAAVLSGNWKDFRTILLAIGMTLACFVMWHILRVPWLIHKSVHSRERGGPGNWAGVFGVMLIVGILFGGYELGRTLWDARPLGTINAVTKAPAVPTINQTRVVSLQEPCKTPPEQLSPVRVPQPCSGSSAPTPRDRVMAFNARLTEGDRNRFTNALADFDESLKQGVSLEAKIFMEGQSLEKGYQDGTVADDLQTHESTLAELTAEGKEYFKSYSEMETKWNMFADQRDYIFEGSSGYNEGPNALINAADGYRDYLQEWSVIQNKQQKPVLTLLATEQNQFGNYLRTFDNWYGGCKKRLTEMRDSIR